jgi:hypothetical protein
MADKQEKCGHPACTCVPEKGSKYCSTYCSDAGSDEIEISCDCGHATCASLENIPSTAGMGAL